VLLLCETQHGASIYSSTRNTATLRPASLLTRRKICLLFGPPSEYPSFEVRSLFYAILFSRMLHTSCRTVGRFWLWNLYICVFVFGATAPTGPGPPSFTRFLDHTQRRITVGRTPLYEWSARRRDLYLTTHTKHSQQTNVPALGGIRTHDLSRRAAAYLCLTPRGDWDRRNLYVLQDKFCYLIVWSVIKFNCCNHFVLLSLRYTI